MQANSLELRAEKTDVSRVERMFAHYAPLHEFRDMKKMVLEEYTRNDEFEIAQQNISQLKDNILTKADKKHTVKTIEDQFNAIQRQLEKYVKNSRFDKHVEDANQEMEKIVSKVSLASNDLKNMRTYSEHFNNKLSAKVDRNELKSEIEKIKNQFDNF
jgi:acetolactate synthase small subunit